MRETVFPDLFVGSLDRGCQRLLGIDSVGVTVGRDDRLDCQPAGLLPAFIASHAVGNDRQPALALELPIVLRFPVAEGILVILAVAADVGLTRHLRSRTDLERGAIVCRTGGHSGIRVRGQTF